MRSRTAFGSGRSVATAGTDTSNTFARGSQTFRGQKESTEAWITVLGSTVGERVYRMERWPAARR